MNDEIMTIDAEQRQRDFVSSAADAGSLVGGALVHHMFERQAERSPDRVAVRAGGEALSYSKLNARAIRIARALRARGVGRGQRVGLCVERDAEMLAAVLGILKAGGAYVPLDPTFPPERLRFMAQDAELAQLVSTSALAERLTPDGDLDAGTEDPAYVIYTSGSTGKPKGVIVPHRAVVNFLASMALEPGLSADDVLIAVTTLSFDIAVLELQLPLAAGATVVIANRDQGFDGRALKTLLERHQATVMQATPVTWRLLLDAGWKGQADFKALVGGEALPKDLADQLIGCGVELWNMYGPTETTVWSTCARITDTSSGITIGKPIANTTVHVLDAQNDPCPIGVAGELCIGGEGVTLGYWKRPELTADHFVPDPFDTTPGATLYRTGDLARWRDDGRLEHLGRLDLQIKIRGFRIELGEIESIIADYPGVRETVAIAREDAPGDQRLVAYLVLRDNEVAIADLRLHVSRHLPSYMVPSAFVTLDALPLTPNAKIDRKALPAPQPSDFLRSDYVAPQTATEELLAGIWSEVLGLERVGTHDNFFELGGHSLLVVSVVERMRRAGLNAGAHSFYLKPTIAELAAAADNEGGFVEVPPNRIPPNCEAISPDMLSLVELSAKEIERLVAAVPGGAANVQDIYGLAPLQEGLLFHHRMTSGGDGYLTRTLYGFESRDQLDRYLQAFQKVVDRNDILRTALLWEGLSEPVQVVYRQVHLVVEEVDLSGTEGDAAQQLRARFNPRKYRLDVRQAPLIRICIAHDPANNRWLMQQMVHHLIDDQVTMNFVREEVQAHLLGQADKLPEPLPFRNFVAQSRTSVPSEAHEAFFREMLGDVDETTAPFGLTDVQGDGSEIVEALAPLDPILSRRLRQAAQAFGVSAASLFHLAFALMLARVSGREDVVFGTVLLGRMQGGEGAERMLGTCINTLPLRLQVADAGVQESVRNTHLLLAQLLRHEHAQLALAQRCSSVAANAPLFSALLNYRYGQPDGQSPDSAGRVIDGMEVLDFEERTNFPLTLCVDDLGEGFRLVAQMQSPIDPERICAYMEISLRQLVGAMEGAPTRPLSHLDVLPDDERHRLLIEWNDTERGYGDEARLHRLIERQVAKTPNSVALEFEGQTLTYAELNQRANQLARLLRRKGVRPEVLVGVFAERSFEMVLALLAVLKAGGAYVPLDPSYPAERLGHMIEDAKAPLVLAQPHLASQLPSQVEDVHLLDASWQSYAQEAGDNLEDLGTPQNLAYVIFTSGSTGRPKGAMNQHDGICNRILWMQEEYGLTSDDRVLQKTQFSFDVSTWEFYWPLITGARLVIARPDGHRDSAYLVELIQSSAVTTLHFVPSMLRVFVEEAGLEDCRSLRQVMCSGEALPHELQERFFSPIRKCTCWTAACSPCPREWQESFSSVACRWGVAMSVGMT
jgi:amino acid adenylation domain-containing protein